MSPPFFKPWVGKNYVRGEGLLLVGEAHYGPSDLASESTISFTQAFIDGENHKFWTNIMQVVDGMPYAGIDRARFWNDVAFYNFVQQSVGESAGTAPTAEMLELGSAPFFSVVEELQPRRILVLSSRMWQALPNGAGRAGPNIGQRETERETWLYPQPSGEALASSIPHPSLYFSWQKWHPVVEQLLSRDVHSISGQGRG
jgi:hypothetical protein